MDATLGDPQQVTEQAVQESLARARDAVAEPAERAKEAALARAAEAEASEAAARFQALSQAAEAGELRERLGALEEREQRRASRIRARIERRAKAAALILKLVAWMLVLASMLVGAAAFLPDQFGWLPAWSLPRLKIASVVVLGLSGITLIRGKSVGEWIDRWREASIKRHLQDEGLDESE